MVMPMQPAQDISTLVFTDLDGTLLDHDSYSAEAARPALEQLQQNGIPVIPVTSKTFAELEILSRVLPFDHPWIIENGGIIVIPKHYFLNTAGFIEKGDFLLRFLGPDYQQILTAIDQVRNEKDFCFEGFYDLEEGEIAKRTGLALEDARRAKARLCSEPIDWQDTEIALQEFKRLLASHGLELLQGGRFWHVMGKVDKASAISVLSDLYREAGCKNFKTIALGDSPNDRAMLESVQIPVVIRKKDGSCMAVQGKQEVYCTEKPGPAGWNEFILNYLDGKK
jgi:mannosyl-3-phosphoglycerate phosphatase